MPGLWITPDDLGDDYSDLPYVVEACEAASQIMWALSGRKYQGQVTVTERYTLQAGPHEVRYLPGQDILLYDPPAYAYLIQPIDFAQKRVRLRGKPVRSIASIHTVLDGEEVDSDTYGLWDHAYILFDGGINSDLDINYTYGTQPPAAGRMAARELAIQFALLWSDRANECSLPDRVTSVTRQDVAWTILDNQDFLDELKTGVYAIDLFLKSVNPDKARMRSKVFSPDIPRGRRNTSY